MESTDEDRMRHLRTGFDQAAEDYQRTRPVCPPQLFDDLRITWPTWPRSQEKRNTGPRAGNGRTAPAGIRNA